MKTKIHKSNKLSLASQGIRYKLKLSFYLMSILPLCVSLYILSNYIFPQVGFKLDIIVFILISIFIAVIGFLVIKDVIDRILSVSSEAKLIVAGDINRKLQSKLPDEVGDLSDALNQLTQRIHGSMEELKSYSEKTTEINLQIQKRVMVLSSLLQISSLISQDAKLEDVLKLVIEKSRLLANSDTAYLLFRAKGQDIFSMKMVEGINSQFLSRVSIGLQDNIFNKIIKTNRPLVLDKENELSQESSAAFYEKFGLKNTVALPICLRGMAIGILGIGNTSENFLYTSDDIELLDVFAKQLAIAVENDILTRRVEELEIKDALTGLYNEAFIRDRLKEEIKRAIIYRRPCAFVLLNVDNFKEFYKIFGSLQAEASLKKIASLIRDSVNEIDRVARIEDNEFAIVLPEKNKRQAQEVAEAVRKKVELSFSEEQDIKKRLTISGGISENPLDGIEAEELIIRAKELLNTAKLEGKNRILAFK